MRPLLVAPALLSAVVLLTPAPASADPLLCIDAGRTHVYDHTVDWPEVCLL